MIHGSSTWSILVGSGIVGRVVQLQHHAVGLVDAVDDRGGGDDEVEVELALEPLLDDLEMQQTQEAAAEAEAQGDRALRLVLEARVVQAQLAEAVAQVLVLGGVGRVHAAEHDRLDGRKPGSGAGGRLAVVGDGVADPRVRDLLDARR